ncbi:MAG: type IV secretion system protein [Parcubacteria group bacterium]|jgi:hypothetical protein
MKKNGNSPIKFVDNLFNRIKNSLKNPSKKAFGKIGLFLILGVMILNINFTNSKIGISAKADWIDDIASRLKTSSMLMAVPGGSTFLAGKNALNSVGVSVSSVAKGGSLWVFNWLLYSVLWAISKLLIIAAQLLDFALNTDYLGDLIKEGSVYKLWAAVRDILNLFFMLLLLFSAFCTIFQVEKYNLKKIIIMLVVMALLVNFSYAIAVFVVDFSNSAMRFLVEVAFPNSSSASSSAYIGKVLKFGDTLKNQYNEASFTSGNTTGQIIVSIVLLFIYTVTIMALAINLLIRMIAFIVLVILSPFGFVFAFFPGTSSISNDWWDKLLKYAFMGPVLAFFLLITMVLFSKGTLSSSTNVAGTEIPIHIIGVIFLWMGLTISQKMGGMGSEMAMGMAKKVGNNIKSYGQKAAWGTVGLAGKGVDTMTGHRISGGIGGLKAKWDSWGENYKTASTTRKTQSADFLGVKGANEKLVQENLKKYKEGSGISDAETNRIDSSGSKAEKMALALHRAETKGFDKDPDKALKQYQEGLTVLGDNDVYKNLFESNVRKKNVDLIINEEIVRTGATGGAAFDIAKKEFAKLNTNDWKEQNIERIVATASIPGKSGVVGGATDVINGYSPSARAKLTSEMRGDKYMQGQGAGMWA